ncbi:MAG: DnaJ domain-containing protein [Bacillota bacterium]|nr:DnaJ domain-containing protein [Bacillota bacterium]
MKDPYSVLGVSPSASDEEIRNAYRELAKKYHPDNYAGNPLADLANEKMKEVNEAYDEIMNKRASGDRGQSTYSGGWQGTGSSNYPDIRETIMRGQADEAINRLNAVSARERGAEWHFLMGSALYKKGWVFEARGHFGTACSLDPSNAEYANAYNNISQSAGNFGGYRNYGNNNDQLCNCCAQLWCADCLCESCGGDLIPCC